MLIGHRAECFVFDDVISTQAYEARCCGHNPVDRPVNSAGLPFYATSSCSVQEAARKQEELSCFANLLYLDSLDTNYVSITCLLLLFFYSYIYRHANRAYDFEVKL